MSSQSNQEVCDFKPGSGTQSDKLAHTHEHSHGHEHSHAIEHGHTHDVLDHPGRFHERPPYNRTGRDWGERAFTIGIGGPVGSGKTALMLQLCRALREKYNIACVTNDIFTREDAEFLTRNDALEADRIVAVETGGCPHAAVREDITANLHALETLHAKFDTELLLIESGGDNLAANFSRELADYIIYVIDVSGGDKVPRKGGPGITMSDLLVINKTDLAEAVGADLDVMLRDANHIRDGGPVTMAVIKHGKKVDEIVNHCTLDLNDFVTNTAELLGPKASGKETVARYLAALGFTRIHLDSQHDADNSTRFKTAKGILNFVTPRWQRDYVTTDVTNPIDIYRLWKRPFVLVVGLDAPVLLRYKRYRLQSSSPLSVEGFVEADDRLLYTCQEPPVSTNANSLASTVVGLTIGSSIESSLEAVAHLQVPRKPQSPVIPQDNTANDLCLRRVLASANVTIANTFATIEELYAHLDKIDLTNKERLRPSWDTYFMLLSELASHRSNCMKRRVGCILVKDNQIIATGYNGTPKGVTNCNEGGCPRCNDGTPCGVSLDHCLCIHAEENALLEAGRGRVRSANDVVLYCNTCPCLGCAKKIVQVGVKVVVYCKGYGMDELTLKLFREAKIQVRQHTPPTLSMEIGSP
ncbi:hypothetical protein LPJ78_001352 [Coemansia sp. RSA 989]|nr:hypothetical protein LPJ78_001352 [Coemansia sp. RSA 989]